MVTGRRRSRRRGTAAGRAEDEVEEEETVITDEIKVEVKAGLDQVLETVAVESEKAKWQEVKDEEEAKEAMDVDVEAACEDMEPNDAAKVDVVAPGEDSVKVGIKFLL